MTAKAGDTLAKVGRRYGLTPGDLARINRFSYNTELHDGQRIVVYSPTGDAPREVTMGMTPESKRPKGSAAAAVSTSAKTPAKAAVGKTAVKTVAKAGPTTVKKAGTAGTTTGSKTVAAQTTAAHDQKSGARPASAVVKPVASGSGGGSGPKKK